MEDRDIIQMYFKRNEEAIRYTQLKYGSGLRTIAQRILYDPASAEECENDTYLRTWNSIPPNDPSDHFFAFLARIIRNLSIDTYRKRTSLKRNACMTEISDELAQCIAAPDDTGASLEAHELGDIINLFLKEQKKEKRIIFVRRYFYIEQISDIAGDLGISESKVKTTLFRMRTDLKDYLNREGYTI